MTGLVVAAVLAIVVAFVISMAESAFQRMSRVRAEELLDEGRAGATALVRVVGDTAAYLSVLSFVRVIAESTAAVMVTLAAVVLVEGTWQPFLVAIGVVLYLVSALDWPVWLTGLTAAAVIAVFYALSHVMTGPGHHVRPS